jgi:RimJ/RimL family protein N-acetyltransferase
VKFVMAQSSELKKVSETSRLLLREWRHTDIDVFASLNADPRVMEHFVKPLTQEESRTMLDVIQLRMKRDGFGLWALELKESGECIGFTGLNRPGIELPFSPRVEIGWRIAHAHWGRGYATEAARAALGLGFDVHGLREIVAFTTPGNLRSSQVMEKLGVKRDLKGDFVHPGVPDGHPLKPHLLYRLSTPEFINPPDASRSSPGR